MKLLIETLQLTVAILLLPILIPIGILINATNGTPEKKGQ